MIVVIPLLTAALIYAIANKKIVKAEDLCIGNCVIPSIILTDMFSRRFLSGGGNTNKYYYSINGVKGAGTMTTDSLIQIIVFIAITTAFILALSKLGDEISKKIFIKEKDGEGYVKLAVNLMIIASVIVGLVGLRYLYFGIMSRSIWSFIYAGVLLTLSIYQLKKYIVDKNYNTKNVL